MTSNLIDELLSRQHECVAAWQLAAEAPNRNVVDRALRSARLRPVAGMDGVWTACRGTLTDDQRRMAATLTAPDTGLAYVSAALHWGFGDERVRDGAFVVVVRRGHAGPKRFGDVLVCRAPEPDFVVHRGIRVTTPARTLADLAAWLDPIALRRAVIEALRIGRVTLGEIIEEMERHPRRRGCERLRDVVAAVRELPIGRCRSNAEAEALVRRREAGRPDVAVNVRIGGFEADLVDRERRHIVEIDGASFHLDSELDARKTASWEAEGFTVTRRASAEAYDQDASW